MRNNKPLNSPDIDHWYEKGGKISIDENGVWAYHDWEGNIVTYPNGYPDFKTADLVRQAITDLIPNDPGNISVIELQ